MGILGQGTVGDSGASGVERQRKILVAEDSSITQDLLKLVLSQRGHRVDIVNDGNEALEALVREAYDIALLDFHLPGLDGVQVVRSFLAQSGGGLRPWFVAITADVEGLLAHEENCESFDKVVPKPVDIQEISRVIDEAGHHEQPVQQPSPKKDPATSEAFSQPELAAAPQPRRVRVASALSSKLFGDRTFVRWPDDFDARNLSGRALQAKVQQGNVDALLIEEPATVADLERVWEVAGLHLYPVIDLTGTLGEHADIDCSKLAANETDAVFDLIESFHDKRARIHPDAARSENLDEKILGRMFIADAPLRPTYDGAAPSIVRYNILLDGQSVINHAAKLVEAGFLAPKFFDRVHVCGGCGSSQFNVREECPECRSSDLKDELYLHHFRCAYQGPESDFRHGDDLVCPKCRKELAHFGSDYDKPGTMIVCNSCAHTTSEPMVGFVCLSCGQHTDGDAIRTRDISRYALTDKATGFLEAGNAFLGFTQQTLRFADLPLDLVVALNDQAKRFNEDGTPFALLDISYQNAREIDREYGPRQFFQLRELFLENLRNVLANDVATAGEARVVKGQAFDFAMLKETKPDMIRQQIGLISAKASEPLRLDLGVTVTVFGPEDLS